MTTIAFDGIIFASDGLLTCGSEKVSSDHRKIFLPKEGESWSALGKKVLAFGISGEIHGENQVKVAIEHPEGFSFETRFPKGMDFTYILVLEDGEAIMGGSDKDTGIPWMSRHYNPVAIGSGSKYASGAMAAGLNASKAVEVASTLDVWTGSELFSHSLKVLYM